VRENAGGQFLHWFKEADPLKFRLHHYNPPSKGRSRNESNWDPALKFYALEADLPVRNLALAVGVSVDALHRLCIGWHRSHRFWTIPERDADGRVIGVSTRYENGSKKRVSGSKAGLTYAQDWDSGSGPIFLVEGASDTAALMTIGLNVVGRPSNCGGTALLIDLLFEMPIDREIVVVGERDEKPDGKWPGKTGAISTATKLAEGLERPIGWALPPDNAKDSRAWLKAMPQLPRDRLADLFISGLEVKHIQPPVTLSVEPEPRDVLPLEQWRTRMLEARLESLGNHGVYLDRSPTGSGKSHVDFAAIQHLLLHGGAA